MMKLKKIIRNKDVFHVDLSFLEGESRGKAEVFVKRKLILGETPTVESIKDRIL